MTHLNVHFPQSYSYKYRYKDRNETIEKVSYSYIDKLSSWRRKVVKCSMHSTFLCPLST